MLVARGGHTEIVKTDIVQMLVGQKGIDVHAKDGVRMVQCIIAPILLLACL